MSSLKTTASATSKAKPKSKGWVPDQHGAWVMVTVPVVLGVFLAGPRWIHLPLTIAWYAGYFAFFALSWWLRARGKRRTAYVPALATYGASCAVATMVVVWRLPSVLMWAGVFGVLMPIAVYEAYRRRPRSLLSGLSTVLASTAMVPLASFVVGESLSPRLLTITALIALYFCGTIFYVKSLIRERNNLRFRWVSVGFHAVSTVVVLLLVGWGLCHWGAVLVFSALTLRAWLMPWLGKRRGKPWTPKFVGMTEGISTLAVVAASLF
ncbi:YwiC-like family protein [Corynebacterium sp. H127]|uniref:YwiC-like family protein n=1 Tax=Corynebacterium sp. H127 TaxID=3133418 RepID=UPI0030B3F2D6